MEAGDEDDWDDGEGNASCGCQGIWILIVAGDEGEAPRWLDEPIAASCGGGLLGSAAGR